MLHACTRPLPAERGDFGSGVIDLLGSDDVFVSLIEFGSEVADQGLFARQGRPALRPSPVRDQPAGPLLPGGQRGPALLLRGRPGVLPVRRPRVRTRGGWRWCRGPSRWCARCGSTSRAEMLRTGSDAVTTLQEATTASGPAMRAGRAGLARAGPVQPPRVPGADRGGRLGARRRPAGLRAEAADRGRGGRLRAGRVSCSAGYTVMCCTINNGRQRLPAGHLRGRLVEGRGLLLVLRRLPVHHRLQRDLLDVLAPAARTTTSAARAAGAAAAGAARRPPATSAGSAATPSATGSATPR